MSFSMVTLFPNIMERSFTSLSKQIEDKKYSKKLGDEITFTPVEWCCSEMEKIDPVFSGPEELNYR